jgi:Zn-dependent metalloprotease
MKKILLLITLLIAFHTSTLAQPSISRLKAKIDPVNDRNSGVKMDIINETQANISFSLQSTLRENQSKEWINDQLELRRGIDNLSEDGLVSTGTMNVRKYHQYYKGIRVEHGVINTTSSNGRVAMMQMEYYSIGDNFKVQPALDEKAALQKAVEFVGAVKYAWQGYTGNESEYLEPRGELVIVSTYKQHGEVCLAYKFNIYALQPVSRAWVYVNAWDGTVVLIDPIIKHATRNLTHTGEKGEEHTSGVQRTAPAGQFRQNNNILSTNIPGTAATRFVGQQTIITDNNSGDPAKRYRLRENRNGQNIITLNYNLQPYNVQGNPDAQATDYTDNDNNWTAAEHHNDNTFDDAALDVHFNMELVCDYWKFVHQRNGWDNSNGEIKSFVNVQQAKWNDNNVYLGNYFFPNAFWNGKNMHFGNGTGDLDRSQPYTTLDISAHEMGHAITETTSGLIYQWESGALNEAFSDIWAACVTNYAKVHNSSLGSEVTWRVAEKCENINQTNKGFRDMSNPGLFHDPASYKNFFWKPADYTVCKDFEDTDNCGVHSNSGVLNKWFYLITEGENSYNTFGTFYNVTGLGFGISQKIAYLTSINLTP